MFREVLNNRNVTNKTESFADKESGSSETPSDYAYNAYDSADVDYFLDSGSDGVSRVTSNYTNMLEYGKTNDAHLNEEQKPIAHASDSVVSDSRRDTEAAGFGKLFMDAQHPEPEGSSVNDTEHLGSHESLDSSGLSGGLSSSLPSSTSTTVMTNGDSVDSRTEPSVGSFNNTLISLVSWIAAPTETLEIVNEIVPPSATLSSDDQKLKSNSHTHTHIPDSSLPASTLRSTEDVELEIKVSGVATERAINERHRTKNLKARWEEKKIRHIAKRGRKAALSNFSMSASTTETSNRDSLATLEQPSLKKESSVVVTKGPIRSLQRETHINKDETNLPQTTSPISSADTSKLFSNLEIEKTYHHAVVTESDMRDRALLQERSTKGPVSLKRYTTHRSHVKRTTENANILQEQSTASVCSDDPCGRGVACHPVDGGFLCLCSDNTEVDPGQPCLNIKAVNYTPPAIPAPVFKADNEALNRPSQSFLLGAVITMGLFVFFLLSLIYWRRNKICKLMRQRNSLKIHRNSNENVVKISTLHTFNFASNPNYYTSPPDQLPLHSLSVQLISKDQITFLGDLGEGCFGRVYKGEYDSRETSDYENEDTESQISSSCLEESDGEGKGAADDNEFEKTKKKTKRGRIVAVKVLKELVGMEAEADFMREVEIMASFRHPNILSLIGVVVAETGGTPWMVFEFMPYGDLAEVLRSCNKQYPANYVSMKPLNKAELLNICLQVALGMEYLSHQHFVHRDLACRNCLVGKNLTVKISDFGMSRDVYTCDYYKVGGSRMLPVRWMAPESILYGKFTLESDVWSFGVVLWEIYSYGKQPYYGNSNEDVVQLILQGILLSPSDFCPQPVKEVMRLCWSTEAHNRLTFPEIVQRLKRAQEVLEGEQIFQELFPELNYSQLCMHESPEKLPTDNDHYLLPTLKTNQDEYLTVLGNP